MNEVYLMVNGKKIDLPKKVLEDILKNLVETDDQKIIDEFWELLRPEYPPLEKKVVNIIKRDNVKYLVVDLPNCNTEWTFGVYKAVEKFISDKRRVDRYPTHYSWQNPTKFYIYVGPEK